MFRPALNIKRYTGIYNWSNKLFYFRLHRMIELSKSVSLVRQKIFKELFPECSFLDVICISPAKILIQKKVNVI